MNIQLVLKKPRRKRDPLNGLVYYKDGNPIGTVELQFKSNKKMDWQTVEVKDEDK